MTILGRVNPAEKEIVEDVSIGLIQIAAVLDLIGRDIDSMPGLTSEWSNPLGAVATLARLLSERLDVLTMMK